MTDLAQPVESSSELGLASSICAKTTASASAPRRARASPSWSESPTSRCWAPSWRSRSRRRRSASPVATTRARDVRRCSSWARISACSRSFSSARRAAAATSSATSGSSSRPGRCDSSATRSSPRTSGVTSPSSTIGQPSPSTSLPSSSDRRASLMGRAASGQLVTKAAGRRRRRRLDDEARDCSTPMTRPNPAPHDSCRQRDERRRLGEPEVACDRTVSERAAVEAVREDPGDEREVGRGRNEHRPEQPAERRDSIDRPGPGVARRARATTRVLRRRRSGSARRRDRASSLPRAGCSGIAYKLPPSGRTPAPVPARAPRSPPRTRRRARAARAARSRRPG